MKFGSVRSLTELKPVLKDPNAIGPDPVYQVFYQKAGQWANKTVIANGRIGEEYPKTFGHYHNVAVNETYRITEGEGILLLQKKHIENGVWIPEVVDEVLLIRAKARDEIVITPEWGHSWSNTGSAPLVLYDDWKSGHTPADYEEIERLHGLAYYLIENPAVKAVPNPNYHNLPEPIWLSVEEYKEVR